MRWRTSKTIQDRAITLRSEPTSAEQLFWAAIRGRQLDGYKFRRQHPVGRRYIADFYCAARHLIVELDGPIHDQQQARDTERTQQLEELGYTVVRFPNWRIERELDAVLREIQLLLNKE
jgi:very-short-patch-repair endonuclease